MRGYGREICHRKVGRKFRDKNRRREERESVMRLSFLL